MPGELRAVLPAAVHRTLLDLLWQDTEAAMVLVDAEHRMLQANPTAEQMLARRGYAVGDVLAGIEAQVMSTESGRVLADEDRPVERALRGESVRRQVVDVDYGDSKGLHRMVLSALPIEITEDGPTGALLIWHDVTDSWHFAERSRTELARMGQLLEGASDYAIIMLDQAGLVQSWSPAAELMQGYRADEAIGLPYASFFDDGDRASGLPKRILTKAAGCG
jgi:PAS domain-containing protein